MKRIIMFCAMTLVGTAMAAPKGDSSNDLWVTEAKVKGGTALAVDVESDGRVVSFQFVIDVPGLTAEQLDLSRCLSSLPSTHQGGCVFRDGQIRGGAFSPTLAALPAGTTKIGTIMVKGKHLNDIRTHTVELSDKDARLLSTKVNVERDRPDHQERQLQAK